MLVDLDRQRRIAAAAEKLTALDRDGYGLAQEYRNLTRPEDGSVLDGEGPPVAVRVPNLRYLNLPAVDHDAAEIYRGESLMMYVPAA